MNSKTNKPSKLEAALAQHYTVKFQKLNMPDGSVAIKAWYAEMPGCYVISTNIAAAEWELQRFRVSYIQEKLAVGEALDMPAAKPRYKIRLADEQLSILWSSCDIYGRVQLGQLERLLDWVNTDDWKMRSEFSDRLRHIASAVSGLPVGASPGIGSDKIRDTARVAYDLHQVARNYLSWKRHPEGGIGISFDQPVRWSVLTDLAQLTPAGEDHVSLHLTEVQLKVIQEACNLYAQINRFNLGAAADTWHMGQVASSQAAHQLLRAELVQMASKLSGLPLEEALDIEDDRVLDSARIAWDISQSAAFQMFLDGLFSDSAQKALPKLYQSSSLPLPLIEPLILDARVNKRPNTSTRRKR